MNNILRICCVFLLCWMGIAEASETSTTSKKDLGQNLKLSLHGKQRIPGLDLELSEWFIFPSISTHPQEMTVLVVTAFHGLGWEIETHIGCDWANVHVSPVLDVDTNISFEEMFGIPLRWWSDVEWIIDEGQIQKSHLHVFAQLDYVLPLGYGWIGLETEEVLFHRQGNLFAIGPHYILPVGQNRLTLAYQLGSNQVWLRSKIEF